MAREIIERVLDDLDGTEGAELRSFAIAGQEYEADLNDKNWDAFLKAVAKFIEVATPVKRSTKGARLRKVSTTGSRSPEQMKAIREWANKNGFQVSDRGRIPDEVMTAFDAKAPRKVSNGSAPKDDKKDDKLFSSAGA